MFALYTSKRVLIEVRNNNLGLFNFRKPILHAYCQVAICIGFGCALDGFLYLMTCKSACLPRPNPLARD
jgi:hypothetical protein